MADARRLAELGMVPALAKELAAQITAGIGNLTRLAELTMVPRLAREVVAQIATPANASVRRLAELGMVPVLAGEVVAQIKGGGVPWVPQAQRTAFILPGDSRTAFGFNYLPTDLQANPAEVLWPSRRAVHGYTSWWDVKFGQFSDVVAFNAIAGTTTAEIDAAFDALLASVTLDPNKTYIVPLLCGVINSLSSGTAPEDGATAAARVLSMRDRALAKGPNVCVGLCTDAGAEAFTSDQVAQLIIANNIIKAGATNSRVKVADLASEAWANNPAVAGTIVFKAGHSYDGIHRSERGARADAIRFYNDVVVNLVIPVPASMPPVNLIQNSNYAVPTGGTLGTNVTGSVPQNFSVTLENTTQLTEATASVVARDGKNWLQIGCKQGALGASPLAMLVNITGYNLNTAFVAGDEVDWFIPIRILQGAASLLALDFRLGVNYSSGQTAQSYRAFSYSTGRGDMYSDTNDDLLLRVPRLKINGTVSSVTLLMGMRKQNVVDAVGTSIQIGQIYLGKKAA